MYQAETWYNIPIYNEAGEFLGDAKGNKALYDKVMGMGDVSFKCGTRAPEPDPNQQELPLPEAENN